MSTNREYLNSGIKIPGGLIVVDEYRAKGSGWLFLRSLGTTIVRGGYNARGVTRDIVIFGPDGKRELYREGPYNAITVNAPLRRIQSDIRKQGLDPFLREKQVRDGHLGPISTPSGQMGIKDVMSLYVSQITRRLRFWR
jgi:hypothetical protein